MDNAITLEMLTKRLGTILRELSESEQQNQISIMFWGVPLPLTKDNFEIEDDGTFSFHIDHKNIPTDKNSKDIEGVKEFNRLLKEIHKEKFDQELETMGLKHQNEMMEIRIHLLEWLLKRAVQDGVSPETSKLIDHCERELTEWRYGFEGNKFKAMNGGPYVHWDHIKSILAAAPNTLNH
ncbi:hypothetical protein MO867_18895 [Microbulbifer sp. OS29]|uniref:Uncharacterized protein n=1 Tax=Microbulbifer okhotskensis TaxID=2926617 RepID=A0A9X2J822_9GAMM|nr:hypothetical protein [Microbulbifer okhotskensis]MCO1336405.1 hypothetical protein [Microbulbifer okhotskensis]